MGCPVSEDSTALFDSWNRTRWRRSTMPSRTLLVLANGPGADRVHYSQTVDISRGAAKAVTLQVACI